MTESEFTQQADDILRQIEDAIDESGADIDYDSPGGVLTLTFENNTQIIINRQTPMKQIWLATRAGGFHFEYNEEKDQWQLDRDTTELFDALSQHCSAQAGTHVELKQIK
jgi:CyaY protein